MKEYNIDLVIDKTFNVFAENEQEAKEKAIAAARTLLYEYNSLCIDQVEEVKDEDFDFENEYEAYCYNKTDDKCVHCYAIEADNIEGALATAREFFADDFPNEELDRVVIIDLDRMVSCCEI